MLALDASLNFLRLFWRLRVLRFLAGGFLNLGIRLMLVYFFFVLGVSLLVNYALVHFLTFVFAFLYHSRVTFGVRPSLKLLKRFLASVMLLRLLDYSFVVIATKSALWLQWVSSVPCFGDIIKHHLLYFNVLVASLVVLVIRYLVFTRITFLQTNRDDSGVGL